jgi:hypothetical protein
LFECKLGLSEVIIGSAGIVDIDALSSERFWMRPFSSLLFRTSGQITGCSESDTEHKIGFLDVRNENRAGVRNKKYVMFGTERDDVRSRK